MTSPAPAEMSKSEPGGQVAGDWRLPTKVLLERLSDADMFRALTSHINMKKRMLMSHGVKLRKGTNSGDFAVAIDSWPEKAYTLVIEEWLAKQTKKHLEDYMSDEQHNNDTLLERLSPLVLHWHDRASKPEGLRELTLLFLAACMDEGTRPVAKKLTMINPVKEGAVTQVRDSLLAIVEDPGGEKAAMASKESVTNLLMRLVVAVRFGLWDIVDGIKKEVDGIGAETFDHAGFQDVYNRHLEITKPSGKIAAKRMPQATEDEFPSVTSGVEVLTQCTRHNPAEGEGGQLSFSRVLAIKRQSAKEWKELTQEQAKKLFPNVGTIIHLHSKWSPNLPQEGEFGVWKVQEANVNPDEVKDNYSMMRAVAKVMPAQQVRSFEEVHSNDVEAFKSKLAEVSSSSMKDSAGHVIHLADGIFVRPGQDAQSEYFEEKMDYPISAWKDLEVFQMSSGLNLHIGELPDTNRLFDISKDEDMAIKALEVHLKLDGELRSRFSKALAEISADKSKLSKSVEEIQLDELAWKSDEAEKLMRSLEKQSGIKEALNSSRKRRLVQHEGSLEQGYEEELVSLQEKTEKNKARATDLMDEIEEFDSEIDMLIEKHLNKVRQLGMRMRLKEQRPDRKAWFGDLEEEIAEYQKLVKNLSEKA